MAESPAMAPRQAEILHSTQLLREGNATRGTRPMLPGRAALVRPSPINSSALPHGDKLAIGNSSSGRFRSTRLSTPVPTTFPGHGSGQKSRLRTPRAVSSIAGPASAREKRIGELLHRVEAVAVFGISFSIHASEVPEPCMASPASASFSNPWPNSSRKSDH